MLDELDTVFTEIAQDVKAFVDEILGHKNDKADLQAKLDAANAEIATLKSENDALKAKIADFSAKTKTALSDAKNAVGLPVGLPSDIVNQVLPAVDPNTGFPVA